MEKNNKIILIVIIILTVCVLGGCVYSIINDKNMQVTDASKFRNEYMKLNDKENEYTGNTYPSVILSDTNTIKYISEKKAVELLEKGEGLIYFGFSSCPWCRSLVPTLTSVAEELKEKIYYLDVLDIRSTFEVTDGEIKKLKEGTKNYYKILEILDDFLDDFYLTDDAGNKYDTNEKRLYAPTLVAFKDGKITGFHVGTVDSQKSGYDKLSENEIDELKDIINDLFISVEDTVCTKEKC